MIFLLIDEHNNHSYDFVSALSRNELIVVYPPSRGGKKLQWLLGIFKCLRKSKSGDTIVFAFDFQAVLCSAICVYGGLKRNLVCVNLLLDINGRFRNKLVRHMYARALRSPHFKATVTSLEYGSWLNGKLGTHAEFKLLRDVMSRSYFCNFNEGRLRRVFCGGRNGRNWSFIYALAESMPDIPFMVILPAALNSKYHFERLPNVDCICDCTSEAFLHELARSSLLCMPLDREAPAGLIVMFQATANLVPVISSSTATTREYLTEGRGILLPNEVTLWQDAVRKCLSEPGYSAGIAERFYSFCAGECSEEKYVSTLDDLLI